MLETPHKNAILPVTAKKGLTYMTQQDVSARGVHFLQYGRLEKNIERVSH